MKYILVISYSNKMADFAVGYWDESDVYSGHTPWSALQQLHSVGRRLHEMEKQVDEHDLIRMLQVPISKITRYGSRLFDWRRAIREIIKKDVAGLSAISKEDREDLATAFTQECLAGDPSHGSEIMRSFLVAWTNPAKTVSLVAHVTLHMKHASTFISSNIKGCLAWQGYIIRVMEDMEGRLVINGASIQI